jgi:hypothetical protein
MENIIVTIAIILMLIIAAGLFLLFTPSQPKQILFIAEDSSARSERGHMPIHIGKCKRYEGKAMHRILDYKKIPPEIDKEINRAEAVFIFLDPKSAEFGPMKDFIKKISIVKKHFPKYQNVDFTIITTFDGISNSDVKLNQLRLNASLEGIDHYNPDQSSGWIIFPFSLFESV